MNEPSHTKGDPLIPFLTFHLNRIYYGKKHVLEKIPRFQRSSSFQRLRTVLKDLQADITTQLARIDTIYEILNKSLEPEKVGPLVHVIDYAFEAIYAGPDHISVDLSLIYYLKVVEGIELSCFKLLQIVAVKIGNTHVKELLRENYEASRTNRVLLMLTATKYI